MSENKIKITHGFHRSSNFKYELEFFCRNTDKYLPLPIKFQDLLRLKYLQSWYIQTSIFRFGKRIPMNALVDELVEFTIAHEPNTDTMVIAICHPKIQFRRKAGVKIVKQRMEWALQHPSEERKWKHNLKK